MTKNEYLTNSAKLITTVQHVSLIYDHTKIAYEESILELSAHCIISRLIDKLYVFSFRYRMGAKYCGRCVCLFVYLFEQILVLDMSRKGDMQRFIFFTKLIKSSF